MAKTKPKTTKAKKKKVWRALVGGNLADGTPFSAGEDMTGCPKKDFDALKKMGAIVEDA